MFISENLVQTFQRFERYTGLQRGMEDLNCSCVCEVDQSSLSVLASGGAAGGAAVVQTVVLVSLKSLPSA